MTDVTPPDLPEAARELLDEYARLLTGWPGLIGRGQPAAALVEDCLTLLPHLGDARGVVDVGSGGGMPGIPLAIARPDLGVSLLESDQRKAAFLHSASARLGVPVEVLAERAETVGRGDRRESFDLAVCRALAPLAVLAELCLPLLRVGGTLLAMKGPGEDPESAIAAVAELGGGRPRLVPAPSAARPGGVLVVVEKPRPTPAAYPRRPGVPARRPLAAP
ncbi:MAG TPA: 16S rRNA (guanine(527)-N(7))-methyltransferase RsmG [Candidatus Dormibacteraeota bacterium]|nr:16S rRNA (guanine(527)-N(7))-methyltransferase RsmG [Candidatus Dormibacteraeota bacterium]